MPTTRLLPSISLLAVTVLLTATLPPDWLAAQAGPEPGTRIRVTHWCELTQSGDAEQCAPRRVHASRVTGTFVAVQHDTLVFEPDRLPCAVKFPIASVARVEVWQGNRSHWLAGAGIGALVGMTSGMLVGVLLAQGDESGIARALFPVLGGIAGAPVGLIAGGGVGLLVKTDRWDTISLERWRAARSAAECNGFCLAVTVDF